jgi:hypothetical protein
MRRRLYALIPLAALALFLSTAPVIATTYGIWVGWGHVHNATTGDCDVYVPGSSKDINQGDSLRLEADYILSAPGGNDDAYAYLYADHDANGNWILRDQAQTGSYEDGTLKWLWTPSYLPPSMEYKIRVRATTWWGWYTTCDVSDFAVVLAT